MILFSKLHSYLVIIFLLLLLSIRLGVFQGREQIKNGSASSTIGTFEKSRSLFYSRFRKYFPSPHSEVLAGTVLGLNKLSTSPTFNDILLRSGTIHVVVVSGFNIVLLFSFVEKLLGSIYKLKNLLIAEIGTLIYALFTGFGYPVIRAWLMITCIYFAKYLGLKVGSVYILVLVAAVIGLVDPSSFSSLSFQLSFLAVLGLIVFSSPVNAFLIAVLGRDHLILKDFSASFAAQLAVWPLLSFKLTSINIISPFANAVLLWVIPNVTVLGLLFSVLSVAIPSHYVLRCMSLFIYPFLDYLVEGATFFAKFKYSIIDFKISSSFLIVYYLLLALLVYKKRDDLL